ncbi:DUF6731 family protein [Clostridium botulinum]|uniref:DUF6731 family protein n=2 Tax=Clostridium botulinum TaxID=1491 RepID=UPI001E34C66F|nr:DUF6731 family protein [Clostridium botulinum]MCD3275250.1 hypothetical protein [Clostridium botulinum C/D]MCD3286573.1 hypothetical protein [Clostridium botulinum C/D]MCD3292024.1 hypothetical protein [Clostridium botulinum C/D]MCD3303892.1 hypothetical protein [Clostridium botulinum C/D]
MSKTIIFYNIAIYKNGEKQDISVLEFIDKILKIDWENRVRKIEDGDICSMFPIHYNDKHLNKRIIPFGKFRRDYKPFVGSVNTSRLKAIKNDVVEMITMLYDEEYRCAVLDYNIHGLKPKGIEQYLASFLPEIDNEIWDVKLEPLISEKGINDINDSEQVKFLEIKLNLNNRGNKIMKQGVEEHYSNLTQLLTSMKYVSEDTDANIIKIQLGIGNKKNATVNLGSIEYLLEVLDMDNSVIESIKVRYKDNNTKKLDTIDLKNIGKQLKDKILENSEDINPAPEFIGNSMIDVYTNYDKTLYANYINFIDDMKSNELPSLQIIPRDKNKLDS